MQKPDQLQSSENRAVVQEYVARPFLLNDSKKFDFRVPLFAIPSKKRFNFSGLRCNSFAQSSLYLHLS